MSIRSSKSNAPNLPWLQTWKKHQFKVFVGLSVIILIFLYFYTDPSLPGTYNTDFIYLDLPSFTSNGQRRAYPTVSKGEQECRRVVQAYFKQPFPNRRPSFLQNGITGQKLEIDCCNESLKVGVEYNGKQHYVYTPGMHRNRDAFRNQQYRDDMKQRMCKEHGWTLISVPYTIPHEEIEIYLERKLGEAGFRRVSDE
jgi:hypothetical protein